MDENVQRQAVLASAKQAVLSPVVQVMTREKFADLSGLSVDMVRGMLERGSLPKIRVGRRWMVNMLALSLIALEKAEQSGFLDDDTEED